MIRWLFAGLLSTVCVNNVPAADVPATVSRTILTESGVKGGLVVHIGCGNGKLTAALRANAGYRVHGLDTRAENVDPVRLIGSQRGGELAVPATDVNDQPPLHAAFGEDRPGLGGGHVRGWDVVDPDRGKKTGKQPAYHRCFPFRWDKKSDYMPGSSHI